MLLDNTTCCNAVTIPDVSAEEETRSIAERVIWSIILILLIMVSLIGNLLVIVCIRLQHRLREEIANIFVVNLSVADIGSAAIVMVSSLQAMASDKWLMGGIMCDIVCGANYTFIVVSMLTLCFISLDRYMAIVHALHYHARVTRTRVYIMVGCAWVQGLCFGLVPILARWIHYDYWEVVCAIVWNMERTYLVAFVVVGFNICFIVPSVVLVVSYCKVMIIASSQNKVQPKTVKVKAAASKQNSVPTIKITAAPTKQNTQRANTSFQNNDNTSSKNKSATNELALSSHNLEDMPPSRISYSKDYSRNTDFSTEMTTLPSDDNDLPGMVPDMHHQESNSRGSSAADGNKDHKSVKSGKKITFITSLPEDTANNVSGNMAETENTADTTEVITQISSNEIKDESPRDVDNNILVSSDSTDISNQPCLTNGNTNVSRSSHSELASPQSVPGNSSRVSQVGKLTAQLTQVETTENNVVTNGCKSSSANCSDDVVTRAREQYPPTQGFTNERTGPQPSGPIIRTAAATTTATKRNYSASNKAIKSLLIVIVSFFICMTPFCVTKLYKVIVVTENMPGYINLVATIFQYIASAINPLIYGIFRKDFQRAFLLVAKRVCMRFKVLDNNTNDFTSATY